jgi:hypothetical protein
MAGWVKNHRKIKDWTWYKKPLTAHLFQHLVREANHKDGNCFAVEIKRGQILTGRKSLAKNTGLSEQQVRTSLNHLKSTNDVTIISTKKYSIITICNYDEYQALNCDDQPSVQPSKQPSTNQVPTTNKKGRRKEDKETTTGRAVPCVSVSENEGKDNPKGKVAERPTWISLTLWDDLLSYREGKGLKNTPACMRNLTKNFLTGITAGHSVEDCVETYIGSGWKTFNVSWMPETAQGDAKEEKEHEGSHEEESEQNRSNSVDPPLASWLTADC